MDLSQAGDLVVTRCEHGNGEAESSVGRGLAPRVGLSRIGRGVPRALQARLVVLCDPGRRLGIEVFPVLGLEGFDSFLICFRRIASRIHVLAVVDRDIFG
jgi:hypothetical protein